MAPIPATFWSCTTTCEMGNRMNASYDILHAIMSKPPVIEVKKSRTRKTTSHEDKIVMELIKKLSMEDLTKLLG